MSISAEQTISNDCKMAFSLRAVERTSASSFQSFNHFVRRTLVRYVRLISSQIRLSSVFLSVCRLWHSCAPSHRVKLFANIVPLRDSASLWYNLGKNQRGSTWLCKLNGRGMKNWRFSTNISLYFENGHSYNGRRIGTCMRAIKWCHFQWLWTTPNPYFKVMLIFVIEYVSTGTRLIFKPTQALLTGVTSNYLERPGVT